jgi:hypothetical protein
MSVSFINELNEIVIFRPATAYPEAITIIKVTKVNYFSLGHSTKHPGQAFQTITSGSPAPMVSGAGPHLLRAAQQAIQEFTENSGG